MQQATAKCSLCGLQKSTKQLTSVDLIRDGVVALMKKAHPDWDGAGSICMEDLNQFRNQYVEEVVKKQKGDISTLERHVLKGLKEHELIAQNINTAFDRQLTVGEKTADKVAEFGGSWRFLMIFGGVLFTWIIINAFVLLAKPFDPYPFILLNLVLSCLAAIQAPIIMMSQNRQEDRDRLRSEEDYRVNLKAELEIRQLNEKLDYLLGRQWQRLLEIQQIQLDLMEEMASKKAKTAPANNSASSAKPAPIPELVGSVSK
ncbi:DUF1003 domain-containing protein [Patescibacteria group bacterium]|nr:DUF1003 domain-containing protein [Patescibacteria group bacterium]MBU1683703.1 DUF1003 domain-containing protein [Patescibacteria group bacterium]MBU1935259.1 DUF1003 domain-containing protein [Patescibacteria group bacterium]